MTLDQRVLETLRWIANTDLTWIEKDQTALGYINTIGYTKDSYLRATYVKRYFEIKADYKKMLRD